MGSGVGFWDCGGVFITLTRRSDFCMNIFVNKNITIFGLGKSGLAAAKRLVSVGAKVFATDAKPAEKFDVGTIEELRSLGVKIELGCHSFKTLDGTDLIVVSPGIHLDIPVLIEAQKRNIPIISEIELAYQFLTKPIIAVTGTNGKTTTTTLIGEFLKAAGKKIAVGGNIGKPLIAIDDTDLDYIVAEISSYQLETIKDFKPWISLILNIQPDHLERHGSMSEYIKQKARIFLNQTGDDYLIYNLDDPQVVEMVKSAKSQQIPFSKSQAVIITLRPEEIKIPGKHNLDNALAAAQAAYLCGVERQTVAEVLKSFPGVEHRIEFTANINGIEFYNDSKATNPDSTLVALDTFPGQGIILILGGKDKGTELTTLAEAVKDKVKFVILIGEATERFKQALEKTGFKNIKLADSLPQAVQTSFNLGQPGDVILLSPACASFDMFANYEERGRVFKKEVEKLIIKLYICENQK